MSVHAPAGWRRARSHCAARRGLMKIILSRKGFDSSAGGCPSPIFEDGTMMSLPIPARDSPIEYADVALAQLVTDLTRGAITGADRAHLDPDLARSTLPRARGWRPLFGQLGAAQRAL